MDDGSALSGDFGIRFDSRPIETVYDLDKTTLAERNGLVDPSLATTSMPFASIPAEALFLTPPTTAHSPVAPSDFFGDHVGATQGARPNMMMPSEGYSVENMEEYFMFQGQQPTTINPAATSRQPQPEVELFPQTPYPDLEPMPGLSAAAFPSQSSAPVPALSSGDGGAANPSPQPSPPEAAPKPPRKKGGRRPSSKRTDAQRAKNLERNRIAASKCRQKKKEWMKDLEATREAQALKRVELKTEKWQLSQEIAELKNQLMNHARCNDRNIRIWITRQAQNFVAGPKSKKATTKRTPLYPDPCNASQGLQGSPAEENGEGEEEMEEMEEERRERREQQQYEHEFEIKPEPDFGDYSVSASGLDPGSSSAMLPSPTESEEAQNPRSSLFVFPMNLDYMPNDMLHGDPYGA